MAKRLTEEEKQKIIELTNQKLSAKQIAEILDRGINTIEKFWKANGLHSKYEGHLKSKFFNYDEIKKYVEEGLSDEKIAKLLNCSKRCITDYRRKNNLIRESLKECKYKEVTEHQKQVLVGLLLGDGSLIKTKNSKSPYFACSHSDKQQEYSIHICELLSDFDSHIYKRVHKHLKKDGTNCISYNVSTKGNKAFLELYNSFYLDGKKTIPIDLLEKYFTYESLAYLIMDDGFYAGKSVGIAICGFDEEHIDAFIKFLNSKFGLHTTKNLHYNKHYNKTYINIRFSSNDMKILLDNISPFIMDWAKYKLDGSQSG